LFQDSTIRKSLDQYIQRRILEIPTEIKQTFPAIKQIWKCKDEADFLYGYYIISSKQLEHQPEDMLILLRYEE
jgi:hypothetical protein